MKGDQYGTSAFVSNMEGVAFMLFGVFGVKAYIATQTTNQAIFDMAVKYLRICCTCAVGIVFFGIFEKLLQATGLTVQSTIAQISGAAYAAVIGQIASFVLCVLFHHVTGAIAIGLMFNAYKNKIKSL